MPDRCQCSAEEVLAGHRIDCPLNEELAAINKPLPAPRKPFEEMTRDEMIIAHAELRASIAGYVAGFHKTQRAVETAALCLDGFKHHPPYTLHETQHADHYDFDGADVLRAQATLNEARSKEHAPA